MTTTPKNTVLFASSLRHFMLRLLVVFGLGIFFAGMAAGLGFDHQGQTSAATNNTINFQARLLQKSGAIAADGNYNVEFKIYNSSTSSGSSQGSCTGDSSCLWTETRTGANTVRVYNGYLTVDLGSVTALPNISWSQDLYLTMNIGGTGTTATWDGEMTPRLHLTATPYSLAAGTLSSTTGSYAGTLSFGSITANRTITLPDTNGTVCLQNDPNCGFLTSGSISGSFINNSTTQQASSNFNISGTGIATTLQGNTSVLTPLLDTPTAGVLNIGTTNATQINLNKNVVVAASQSLTITGGATATRPASPTAGMLYFDTTTNQLLQYNGTKWISAHSAQTKIVAASNSSQAMKDAADYIATGTNDDVTINAALTAAAGGSVYLAEGTYTLGAAISVPDNTTLAGAGTGTLIQLANFGATSTTIDMIANANSSTGTGVTIRDLKLDGRRSLNTAGSQRGIHFTNMGGGSGSSARKGGDISHVTVVNLLSFGIYLVGSYNNTLSDNTATGSAYNMSLSAANNNTITGNIVQGGTIVGINVYNSANNTITGNFVQGNSPYGFVLDGATNDVISGNQIDDNGGSSSNNGIYVVHSSIGNTITGNSITDTSATTTNYAININDAAATKNYLADNTFSSTPGTASIHDIGTGTVYANQSMAENGANLLTRTANSTTAFSIQNAAGTNILAIDSTNGALKVGSYNGGVNPIAGSIVIANATNANTLTLTSTAQNGSYSLNVPVLTGNAEVCTSLGNCATSSGSNYYIQNQNTAAQASANFWISGNGTAAIFNATTAIQTPLLDTATAVPLNIGTTNATVINLNENTTIAANKSLAANGSALFKDATNSTTAFSIQNAAGTSALNVDTTNGTLQVGSYNGGINPVAGNLIIANATNANTLSIMSAAVGQATAVTFPDPGTSSATVCYQGSANCGFSVSSGSGSYIQNGTTPQTANFNISGTGVAAILQAATFDTASAVPLNIGTTNATVINLNNNVSVSGNITVAYGKYYDLQNSLGNASIPVLNMSGNELIVGNSGGNYQTNIRVRGGNGDVILEPNSVANAVVVKATTGNVGIGTTTPGAKLEVNGSIAIPEGQSIQVNRGGAYNTILSQATSTDIVTLSNPNNSHIVFTTNGTEKVRITNTGNFGIGTITPTQKLEVYSGNAQIDYGSLLLTTQSAPSTAPTVAVNTTAGNLTGNYYYTVSFVTSQGETNYGPVSAVVAPAAQQVNLSAIPTGTSGVVTQRKIYRTTTGGTNAGPFYLVATIADNTTTTYTDNIADASLGVAASNLNKAGGQIVVNGQRVFYADSGAQYNTATGAFSLQSNTTGFQNTVSGFQALQYNTTGSYNTASGVNALQYNTTGSSNTASGLQALLNNTTGSYNTASGSQTLQSNTTGSNNTAAGSQALLNNTTGFQNTVSGFAALYFNTTGSQNTASGFTALYSNTTGIQNTVSGVQTLQSNTTGSYNTTSGVNAGYYSQTGNDNVLIGQQAAQGTALYTGANNNTVIGFQAGYNFTSNQSGNVFLGYQAGFNETGSNKLYIANSATATPLIQGDFAASTLTINGNVGIGTTAPTQKLTVSNGNLLIDANNSGANGGIILQSNTNYGGSFINGGQINVNGTLAGRLINQNSEMLDGTTGYGVYDNSNSGHTTISSVADATAPNTSGKDLRISYDGAGTYNTNPTPGYGGFEYQYTVCSGANNAVNGFCYRPNSRSQVRIWANIPVGYSIAWNTNSMGTGGNYQWTTPIAGTGGWQEYDAIATLGVSSASSFFWFVSGAPGSGAFNWNVASVQITALDEAPSVESTSNLNVGYYQGANLGYGQLLTTAASYLAVSGGNVGIGTAGPSQKLDVQGGNINTSGFLQSGSSTVAGALKLTDGTTDGFVSTLASTTLTANQTLTLPNQSGTLCVQGSASCGFATGSAASYIQNTTTQQPSSNFNISGTGVAYFFQATANGAKYFQGGDDAALYDVNIANTVGVEGVQDPTVGSIKLGSGGGTLSGYSGNIGIGTTAPTANLTVSGATGITTTYNGYVNLRLYGDGSGNGFVQGSGASGGFGNLYLGTGSNSQLVSLNNSSGNVGIGTLTPSQKLDVQGGDINTSGNVRTAGTVRLDSSGNLTNIGNITGSGNLQLSGTTGSSYIMSAFGLGTTNPQAGSALTVANSSWISSVDAAGTGYVNLFQATANNQIQVGAALNIDGGILLPTDGGQLTLTDMGFSSSGITAGTPESYTMRIGASNALTVYGENDGAGNAQNVRIAIGSSITPAYTLDVGGTAGVSGALTVGGLINGQTISSAANFTGTLTVASYINVPTLNANALNTNNQINLQSGSASGEIAFNYAGRVNANFDFYNGGAGGGSVALINGTNGNFNNNGSITAGSVIQGTALASTVGTGISPLTVASTTLVTNLNADMVDGLHASAFAASSGSSSYIQNGTSPQTANFNINGNGTVGSLTVNGTTSTYGAIQSFSFNNVIASTPGWFKMGTLTLPQGGYNATLKLYAGNGYNAMDSQLTSAEIQIRTSNTSNVNGSGFAASGGVTTYGPSASNVFTAVKLVSNAAGTAATSYGVYVNSSAAFIGVGYYTVNTNGGSWTNAMITATDPGANSTTTYSLPYSFATMGTLYASTTNVGVANTNPQQALDVTGALRATTGIYTGATGAGTIRLDASGNLSNIGTYSGSGNITTTATIQGNTSVLTPLLDTATAVPLNIGTTNATVINLNENTTIAANKSLTANGSALFKDATNATNAFSVQNAAGTSILNVNTTNSTINVGAATTYLQTNLSFAAKVDYATGLYPDSATTADVNGDGKPDLIVANDGANTVSVLMNNGTGTFAAKVDYATGNYPISATTADVNGDGKPDIIVANYGANTVSVLMNNGNGTFAAKVDYATGSNPATVTTADVNGDGKPDIIVTNYFSNTVSVLMNNGNGTFAAKVDYATGGYPIGVTTADVNGDGKPDIIVTNYGYNTVSVFLNSGTGTFAAQVAYTTGAGPQYVTAADVNGDGKPDLIVADGSDNTVSVLLNSGTGTFAAPATYPAGSGPYSVTTADVNGDGKPDIIMANEYSDTVSVFLNNGNGTFAAQVTYATGSGPYTVTAADVNGDGKPDLVVVNGNDSTVSVLLNTSITPYAVASTISSTISDPAKAGLLLQGAVNQTADLLHIQDSAGVPLFTVSNHGVVTSQGNIVTSATIQAGTVNTSALQTNGVTRIDANGNLTSIGTITSYGQAVINGSLTVQGSNLVAGVNQHYDFSNIVGTTAGWFKLGTLVLPQGGENATIKLYGGSGYSAANSQEGHATVYIRTSNGTATTSSGFPATAQLEQFGNTAFASQVKLVSAGNNNYYVYVYTGANVGNGYYTVDAGTNGTWYNSITTATDPGANSATVWAATPYAQGANPIEITVYITTNLALTAAAQNIAWNGEASNSGGILHSTTTNPQNITIVTPGYYSVSAAFATNITAGDWRNYNINVNGTTVSNSSSWPLTSTTSTSISSLSPMIVYLNAGDIITALTGGANAATLLSGSPTTRMVIQYVGTTIAANSAAGYIQNTTSLQTGASFNIDGTGTAGTFNATTALQTGGTTRLTNTGVLQNVTANASILTSGTVASGLLNGSYTGITAVGTLTSLGVSGNILVGGGVFSNYYDSYNGGTTIHIAANTATWVEIHKATQIDQQLTVFSPGSPDWPLQVTGTTTLPTTAGSRENIALLHGSVSNDMGLQVGLYRYGSGGNWQTASVILQRYTDTTYQGYIALAGNSVCINTYNCLNALGVSGNIGASGSITAGTTPDLSETIPAAPDVTAADVVMADPNNTERVVKATGTYNSTALGVISDGTSSFMINAHGGSSSTLTGEPLVLAGRVPVKVSGENGSIVPGDHLTTSSIAGYAMKATHAGATIGTALGFFSGTTGTVLVLVNPSYYDPFDGNNLQATTAAIATLNATNATITNLTVNTLNATTATITNLTVTNLVVNTAIMVNGHIVTGGTTPTIAVPSCPTAIASIAGNDTAGLITLTTGANTSTTNTSTGVTTTTTCNAPGAMAAVTFSTPFGAAPRVVMTAGNAAAASLPTYVDSSTISASQFNISTTQTPTDTTTYEWYYHIFQ